MSLTGPKVLPNTGKQTAASQCFITVRTLYERPHEQLAAEWRNLPGVVQRGLQVFLPSVRWNYGCFSPWPDTASYRSCLLLPLAGIP